MVKNNVIRLVKAHAAPTLDELVEQLKIAKANVDLANKHKRDIEVEIYKLIKEDLPIKGTRNYDDLKIVMGETYAVDHIGAKRLVETQNLPVDLFRVKYEVNTRAYEDLLKHYPEYAESVNSVITIYPKKPQMTVK